MKREWRVVVAILLGVSIIAVASVALSREFLLIPRGAAYVEGGHLRGAASAPSRTQRTYIDGKIVKRLLIVMPPYSKTLRPLRIHIPVVEDSAIESLEVVFGPLPQRALELAWSVTTIDAYVRYYKAGHNIVWRCGDMSLCGIGTVTLGFFSPHPRLDYFAGVPLPYR